MVSNISWFFFHPCQPHVIRTAQKMSSAVEDALALCKCADGEAEAALTAVWTVSKLAEASENLKQIHDHGAR